jgi:hypothetical protein
VAGRECAVVFLSVVDNPLFILMMLEQWDREILFTILPIFQRRIPLNAKHVAG